MMRASGESNVPSPFVPSAFPLSSHSPGRLSKCDHKSEVYHQQTVVSPPFSASAASPVKRPHSCCYSAIG